MGKSVEEVPDEDDSEFRGRRGMEEEEGGDVGGHEEAECCEERQDGSLVNYKGRWRCMSIHNVTQPRTKAFRSNSGRNGRETSWNC